MKNKKERKKERKVKKAMEKKSKPSLVGEEDEAHLPQNPLSHKCKLK
jgi:hypothetical protein